MFGLPLGGPSQEVVVFMPGEPGKFPRSLEPMVPHCLAREISPNLIFWQAATALRSMEFSALGPSCAQAWCPSRSKSAHSPAMNLSVLMQCFPTCHHGAMTRHLHVTNWDGQMLCWLCQPLQHWQRSISRCSCPQRGMLKTDHCGRPMALGTPASRSACPTRSTRDLTTSVARLDCRATRCAHSHQPPVVTVKNVGHLHIACGVDWRCVFTPPQPQPSSRIPLPNHIHSVRTSVFVQQSPLLNLLILGISCKKKRIFWMQPSVLELGPSLPPLVAKTVEGAGTVTCV